VCPLRFYCPAVDSALDALPRVCPVGAFCNQTGLAAATLCPAGYALTFFRGPMFGFEVAFVLVSCSYLCSKTECVHASQDALLDFVMMITFAFTVSGVVDVNVVFAARFVPQWVAMQGSISVCFSMSSASARLLISPFM
jgi:hypothetical protein